MFPSEGYADHPPSLRRGQIHMKDAHCAEPKEKFIFKFLFFWVFADCIYNFRWRMNCQEVSLTKKNRSKITKFIGKMRNVLKRMKNQILRFLVFEIWSTLYWNSEKNYVWAVTISQKKPPVFVGGFAPQTSNAFGLNLPSHMVLGITY